MKILRLYLKDFRNLREFEITFSDQGKDADSNPVDFNSHAIIGQNGSGKSNLLEAIITIFRDIDLKQKSDFSYTLEYEIRGHHISIEHDVQKESKVVIDKKEYKLNYLSNHGDEYLPSNLFVYYSGKNLRIEKLFVTHQRRYNNLLKDNRDDLLRRLFYCRGGHSQLVLLACLLSKDELFQRILQDLNIEELDSALFILKQPHRLKQNTTEDNILNGDQRFWFAQGTVVSEFLDKLWDVAIAPIDETASKQIDFRGRSENQELIYLFVPDKEALEKLGESVGTPERFFRYAEAAFIGDLIDEVRIRVKHRNRDGIISFDYLSEGEMQLLTVLGLMRITSQDHCLFLLDEPDTHLNPIWKLRYFDEIEKITTLNNKKDYGRSQIIITTHDPLMIGSLKKEQVRILSKEGEISAAEPYEDPQGMGVSGLLKSDMFGLSSTVDTETTRRVHERNQLYAKKQKLKRNGKNLTTAENEKLTMLSKELSDLGFATDFKDPLYSKFVERMAVHTKYTKPILTLEEHKKQDEIADEIIKEILAEEA